MAPQKQKLSLPVSVREYCIIIFLCELKLIAFNNLISNIDVSRIAKALRAAGVVAPPKLPKCHQPGTSSKYIFWTFIVVYYNVRFFSEHLRFDDDGVPNWVPPVTPLKNGKMFVIL